MKEKLFDRHLRLESTDSLFLNSHCVGVINISPARQRALFVNVAVWWECYESSHMLYAPTTVVFSYYSNPALSNDHKNLLFGIAAAQHSVFWLMSIIASDLYGGNCTASGDSRG